MEGKLGRLIVIVVFALAIIVLYSSNKVSFAGDDKGTSWASGDDGSSDDDSSGGGRRCGADVKFMGPSFTLTVTATDDCGEGSASFDHVFNVDDDSSDDDSGSGHRKWKKRHGSDDDSK